jgi:hypothetical protein
VSALEAGATLAADTLIFEGKFVEMDPGSRANRYFVKFVSAWAKGQKLESFN